jgi:hypothetical protein
MQSSFSLILCTAGANLMIYSLSWALMSFVLEPEVHEFRYRQNPKMVLLAYRIYISKLLEDQSGN